MAPWGQVAMKVLKIAAKAAAAAAAHELMKKLLKELDNLLDDAPVSKKKSPHA